VLLTLSHPIHHHHHHDQQSERNEQQQQQLLLLSFKWNHFFPHHYQHHHQKYNSVARPDLPGTCYLRHICSISFTQGHTTELLIAIEDYQHQNERGPGGKNYELFCFFF
jgi:hypothetical protein